MDTESVGGTVRIGKIYSDENWDNFTYLDAEQSVLEDCADVVLCEMLKLETHEQCRVCVKRQIGKNEVRFEENMMTRVVGADKFLEEFRSVVEVLNVDVLGLVDEFVPGGTYIIVVQEAIINEISRLFPGLSVLRKTALSGYINGKDGVVYELFVDGPTPEEVGKTIASHFVNSGQKVIWIEDHGQLVREARQKAKDEEDAALRAERSARQNDSVIIKQDMDDEWMKRGAENCHCQCEKDDKTEY